MTIPSNSSFITTDKQGWIPCTQRYVCTVDVKTFFIYTVVQGVQHNINFILQIFPYNAFHDGTAKLW